MISIEAIVVIVLWVTAYGLLMLIKPTAHSLCVGMWAGWLFLPHVMIDLPGLTVDKIACVTIVTAFAAAMLPCSSRKYPPHSVGYTTLDVSVINLFVFHQQWAWQL